MKSSGFDLVKAQTLSQVFFQTDRAHEQNNLNPMTLQRKLQKTLPIIYMCRPIKFFSSGLDHFDEFKTTNNGLFFFPPPYLTSVFTESMKCFPGVHKPQLKNHYLKQLFLAT